MTLSILYARNLTENNNKLMKRIEILNDLDLELYQYAKILFFQRLGLSLEYHEKQYKTLMSTYKEA